MRARGKVEGEELDSHACSVQCWPMFSLATNLFKNPGIVLCLHQAWVSDAFPRHSDVAGILSVIHFNSL